MRARDLFVPALTVAILASSAGPASAGDDEKERCASAAERAQVLRDEGKLKDARESLLVCVQPACPPAVRTSCEPWLESVERAMPTIVLAARDASGAEITGVRVEIDGMVATDRLDGKAIAIDPGQHAFRFNWA